MRSGCLQICACAFALAIAGSARVAHATHYEPWKDGCPAFFAPEDTPKVLAHLPKHTGADSFGALPELDSPLGPSRIAIGGWGGAIKTQNAATGMMQTPNPDKGATSALDEGQLLINYADSSGAFATATASLVTSFTGDRTDTRFGNVETYVGYRHAKYVLGTAFRMATAIRLGGGGQPFAGSAPGEVAVREDIAVRSPFHEHSFGFDRPYTLTLETRLEMVGCHAPFLDLRIDGSEWQPSDSTPVLDPREYTLVVSAAVGGYFEPHHAIYGEVAEDLRSMRDPHDTDSSDKRKHVPSSHITRTSIGYEWRPAAYVGPFGDFHLGARLSAMTGASVTGWEVAVLSSWQFGSKAERQ